jgi:acetyltransferase-like isoleucine patch superfamily enzyme
MIKRLIKGALRRLLRLTRRLKYQALSTNTWTGHAPKRYQPLLLAGLGTISFQTNVRIGLSSSPKFWSSECYIEARSTSAKVEIGQNTWINNGFSAISNGGSISIGQDCHIGHDVFIIDSDFHLLDPNKRNVDPGSQPVCIGNNVFIGSQVTILKNTHIGDGSVVAASAVVSGTFTARSLIAGNPAKLIRTL